MKNQLKVSIVIPVYNVAPYIVECIQSVMHQTWQGPVECILIDDCGTDDSMAVVEKELQGYVGKVNFQVLSHEKNRGLSAARNTGLNVATGDYVYFLDSDDEITPDCIERLVHPLETNAYDMVIGDYRIVGSDMSKPPLLLQDGCSLQGKTILHAYRKGEWYMLSVNKLYRTDFLKSNNLHFYEGIIHEDELWSFQIACLAQSLFVVGYETYIYKVRAGSITVKKNHRFRCDCINVILREMFKFSKLHHLENNKDAYNLLQNFRMIMMYSVYMEATALFGEFFLKHRQVVVFSWKECFMRDGLDVRKQLRDLYLLLPSSLAIPYLKLLFHFL